MPHSKWQMQFPKNSGQSPNGRGGSLEAPLRLPRGLVPCPSQGQSSPVMLRMLSAMPVGVTVPWVVSPCRMVIMVSSLFRVLVRQDLHTSSLLTTCKGSRL